MVDDSMSARRPLATRFEFTGDPTISPTAMMSAAVSVLMTRMTMSIDRIDAMSNVGTPNGRIAGRATGAADPISEKSALPMSAPIPVPRTRPMRMDRREIVADPTLLSRRMMPKVMKAKRMLTIEAYAAASSTPTIVHAAAEGLVMTGDGVGM